MRLDKLLTETGFGTRTEVKNLLKSRKVKVNDKIEISPKVKINMEKDQVFVLDQKVEYKEYRYYLMYKPAGYITATEDRYNKTVMELLPEWTIKKNLVPVGRLDKDTEGLLLFTNDGQNNHNLLSPKNHVEKKYYCKLAKEIKEEDIKKLEKGVYILDDYLTKESKVEKISDKEIYLTIVEGKFHQVKEMLKAVGNEVIYLRRDTFGKLSIDKLELGQVIEINLEEIR